MIPRKRKSQPSYPEINLGGKVVIGQNEVRTIQWNSPKMLRWFLNEKAKVGDDVSVKIVVKRPKRTDEQNSFLHVYLDLISIPSGHTMDELKAWYKSAFLSQGISEVFGHQTRVVDSSADLNISEFCELMNKIEEATGIPIPDPSHFNLPLTHDEFGKLKLKQKEVYSKLTATII